MRKGRCFRIGQFVELEYFLESKNSDKNYLRNTFQVCIRKILFGHLKYENLDYIIKWCLKCRIYQGSVGRLGCKFHVGDVLKTSSASKSLF